MNMVISFLHFLLSSPLFAASIYVAPVQGTNMSEQQSQTLRELIKVEVQNNNDNRIAVNLDDADFFIQTKVIHFKSYTLSMTRWQGNKRVSSGQWKADTLGNLEGQLATAVNEILNGKDNPQSAVLFENKKSLGERAAEKKRRSNFERVEARRQVVVGFGPAFFDKMNAAESGLGFQAGYVWNIDDHFDLGLQTDFAISTKYSDAHMFSGKIITNYYFSTSDVSPFLGAGFGYGFASLHDSNTPSITDGGASGFAMSLQGGVKFFRTSTVNFMISGEYTRIFDQASLGQPGVFFLKVGLLY